MADPFRALADPTRRRLFEAVASAPSTVKALTETVPVSQPAVSQHLAALREAGLVVGERRGRSVVYRAEPDGLRALVAWVDRYRAFWPEKLDRLEAVLEEME